MKRIAMLVLAVAAMSAVACVETPAPRDNDRPGRGIDPVSDDIVVDADGLARAEIWLAGVPNVRTLGVAVRVQGADVVEWERDDTVFTQNGGRVIPLESRMLDGTFRMIAGTTSPSSVSEDGVRLASLVMRPRAGEEIALSFVEEGNDVGAVDASGARIDIARGGNLSVRAVRAVSGGAQ